MSSHVLRRASTRTRTLAFAVALALAASMLATSPAAGSSGIERLGSLDLPASAGTATVSAVSDATHAYFGFQGEPNLESIVKVTIDGSQHVDIAGDFPLNVGNGWASAAERGDFLYFASNQVPGSIYQIKKDDLTIVKTLELKSTTPGLAVSIDVPLGAHIDSNGTFGYFVGSRFKSGTGGLPVIVKIQLSDMTVAGYRVIDIDLGPAKVRTGLFDETHAYIVYGVPADDFTTPRVMKVALTHIEQNPTSLLAASSVTTVDLRQANHLDATDHIRSAAADGTHVYFGSQEGSVTKVLKSDMSLVSTIQLSEQPGLGSAVIDGTHAYFSGTFGGPRGQLGRVVKVDLSGSMAEVSATNLCDFERPNSAVLASQEGHLLLGLSSPRIVRVGAGTPAACPGQSVNTNSGGGGVVASGGDVPAPVAAAVAAASAAGVAGSSSAVLVRGGEVVPVTSSSVGGAGPRGGVVLETEGLKVTVAAAGGASPQTGVIAPVGGEIVCEVCAELAAGSTVEAWMYSTPQLAAAAQVSDDHEDGDCVLLRIPVGAPLTGDPIEAGAHTLQLRLTTVDGLEVLATGVTVGTAVPSSVPAGDGPAGGGLLGVFGLLAAAAAVAVRRLAVTG